jgi:hypothetical protein
LEALGRCHTTSPLSAEELARRFFDSPAHVELMLDGIALADGRT